MHFETTVTLKVTVKPLRYIPLEEQVDNFSLIDIFTSNVREIRTCVTEVSRKSELKTLSSYLGIQLIILIMIGSLTCCLEAIQYDRYGTK